MWSNFFEAGGWGMFPTLFFGFGLVAAAGLYLLRPERRWLNVVVGLALVVAGSGVLGFITGCINTLHYLAKRGSTEAPLFVLAAGFAESAHNLVLSLMFLVLTGLLGVAGLFRAGRAAAA